MKFVPPNKTKYDEAVDFALFATAEQILTDSNYYIKVDYGTLRDSDRYERSNGKIQVIWDTPYAKRQYYTGQPSRDKNPNASMRWAHKAKRHFMREWSVVFQNALRKKL